MAIAVTKLQGLDAAGAGGHGLIELVGPRGSGRWRNHWSPASLRTLAPTRRIFRPLRTSAISIIRRGIVLLPGSGRASISSGGPRAPAMIYIAAGKRLPRPDQVSGGVFLL